MRESGATKCCGGSRCPAGILTNQESFMSYVLFIAGNGKLVEAPKYLTAESLERHLMSELISPQNPCFPFFRRQDHGGSAHKGSEP